MVEKIKIKNLNVYYEKYQALKNVSFDVIEKEILAVIGPSKSGKTTLIKVINRMIELTDNVKIDGSVMFDGKDIFKCYSVQKLRRRIGVVFALPVPLPMSIFDNIAYGPRLHGEKSKTNLEGIVEKSLRASYLWDEVKDRLDTSAFKLSGGQQQRLCISRTLAVEPEVILYDEPCSGLDPVSTAKVEEAMKELKKGYTQILVTNNVKQAARVSDRTAFFLMGDLIELDLTAKMFTSPSDDKTNDYITGKFG